MIVWYNIYIYTYYVNRDIYIYIIDIYIYIIDIYIYSWIQIMVRIVPNEKMVV